MNKLLENLKSRIKINFPLITLLPLLMLIFAFPAMEFLPIKYSYENSILENFQLAILVITFIVCLKSKKDKNFYNCLALVCVIIFLREINCGRAWFFPIPGKENAFYPWREIKYGFLAEPIYGTFIFASGLYFILSKAYKVLFDYMKNAQIYLYNWILLFIGIVFGVAGEKFHYPIMEEMFESCFYCALLALIWLKISDDKNKTN